ncbi:RagB/SusD family nutrient uptake outer membrane protein [Flavobacterium salilacus subsp. salilacus]|uniref:RagB/SusD family nutrient uptake outer membrane protein n=1 Tax=Flavobacterium TaxID=237 RepID=UPI0010757105|nr:MULTISPECIES: RagB/SusD family nutrient uptake outer membrane protein [Flavobacterium]KAF2519164.1 RagB/SusD family nutrient uptake outer membrane protein [Flavobacterium salilacus subsp. salilacus]MBE1613343.1 RagB/SusD family nutrient uptake outer membrane protein [Flavobacterium sp. SaA2.13]NDI98925.1 RagB/SusD family nutrient uptake outer membrane protein [Flavobacterium salilacus subsp. altitudinum]
MKRKIITAVMALSIFTASTVSCSDDFVERDIVYQITSENYFNSEDDYYNALIAAYDLLHASYPNVILGEIASDNTLAGGESANDVIGWQQVDQMIHTPVNSNLRDIWNWMFSGVNRANYILEFKDKTDFEGKEQIIAEARFLRAYYHFELVKWFGGIPLKGDARFALGDETSIPRATKEEVYASIQEDLLLAIEDLAVQAPEVGRATRGAAQALLGKAYLYDGKYSEAAAVLEQVITSGNYSLVTDYNSIFEFEGENGPESVFEVQYTDIQGASFDCLQCVEGNVAVGFSGPRNYVGPLFTSGFSFNIPTPEGAAIFEEGDLREDVAILNMEEWIAENSGTEVSYGPGYNDTGYFNRKYIPRVRSSEAAGDLNLTNPNNYRAIRYADVLLMAAEAFNRSGNDVKARQYANEVRRRAFGDTDHDFTASGETLLSFILEERRRELFGEGHRFFDLVRTERAAQEIDGFVAGKNEIFPIPLEEIQFSNGNWEQNPNY